MGKQIEYAGNAVSVVRKGQFFSVTDMLHPVSEKYQDTPYAEIIAPAAKFAAVVKEGGGDAFKANIRADDLPMIHRRTDIAEHLRAFLAWTRYLKGALKVIRGNIRSIVGKDSGTDPAEQAEQKELKKLFDSAPYKETLFGGMVNGRKFNGKAPADIILEAIDTGDVDAAVAALEKQAAYLRQNLARFPKNQAKIDAVNEAIRLYRSGGLLPRDVLSESAVVDESDEPSWNEKEEVADNTVYDGTYGRGFIVYDSGHSKPLQREAGKVRVYKIQVICYPTAEKTPYVVSISNADGDLSRADNGQIRVTGERNGKTKNFGMTAKEWQLVEARMWMAYEACFRNNYAACMKKDNDITFQALEAKAAKENQEAGASGK